MLKRQWEISSEDGELKYKKDDVEFLRRWEGIDPGNDMGTVQTSGLPVPSKW